jgi:DNA-binding NtrC family response regulator
VSLERESRPRVLLVEDEPALRRLMRLLLVDEFEVVAVAGFTAASRALESEAFAVVVSDHHLPDGRGTDLLVLAETTNPSSIGIIVTGDPKDPAVNHIRNNAGMVLAKPYDPQVLLTYVRNAAQFARLRTARSRLRGAVGEH